MDNTPNQAIVTVDAAGNVVCTPNPLPANGKNVELKFALQADGYVFPEADALVVSNPGTEFPQPSRTLPPHGTTALLFDRNSEAGTFRYTVTVQRIATGEFFRHDPMISNGP